MIMENKLYEWIGPKGVNPELGKVPKKEPFFLTPAQEQKFLELKFVKEFKKINKKDKE